MSKHLEPVTSLVRTDENGEPTTTSLIIAEGTGAQHASVIRLVRDHQQDFEEFGRVGFEIAPFETAGGVQTRNIAVLNREQATLLMTYMRNTPIVREFKKNLVRAFGELEQRLEEMALSREDLINQFGLPRDYNEALEHLLGKSQELTAVKAENKAYKGGDGIRIKDFIKTYFTAPGERVIFEWFYSHGFLIDGRIYEKDGSAARYGNGPRKRWDHMHPTYRGRPFFKLVPKGLGAPKGARSSRVIPERALDLVALLVQAPDLNVQMTEEGRAALDELRDINPMQLRMKTTPELEII